MKVLFAGPSLSGSRADLGRIALRGPAVQGDIARATLEGATAIGLVDGCFEDVPAVWHKEILFAVSQGVHVLGAASMGALRAAECAAFGMVGIGSIYERYACGELDDDAAVAQLHAPGEFGFAPLTEALVEVQATIGLLADRDRLSPAEAGGLLSCAAALYFKDRTYARVIAGLPNVSEHRRSEIAVAIRNGRVELKKTDAEELVRVLSAAPDERGSRAAWQLAQTHWLRHTMDRLRSGIAST